MRNKLFILIAGAFLLAQSVQLSVTALYLQWNRARIVEYYCVNKAEPELMCFGSCYISEVTVNFVESEKESTPTRLLEERPPVTLFLTVVPAFPTTVPADFDASRFSYQAFSGLLYHQNIFKPPQTNCFAAA